MLFPRDKKNRFLCFTILADYLSSTILTKFDELTLALRSGKRTERVSWLAALKSGQIFAPLTFQGSCNKNLFETWLQDCLLPKLERGDIIIIDNASFHKGEYLRKIIESAGCEIWYLPPYSPDLNKIENW